MKGNKQGRKTLALLLALCMVAAMLPLSAAAEEPEAKGLTVTGGTLGKDYTYENNMLTVLKETPLTISGTTTTDRIVIDCGKDTPAHVTLSGLEIDLSEVDNCCAFSVPKGKAAEVTLQGENTLKSGENRAGLEVPEGAKATLSEARETSGTLTVVGGNGGAGIGGGDKESAGEIVVNSGTVNAGTVNNASGIGGGWSGEGGTVSILGGAVTADGAMGAGIGDGGWGIEGSHSFGTITIQNAFVTATGGTRGDGIGRGYHSQPNGAGTLTISNAWVRTSRMATPNSQENSVILDDATGYGTVEGNYTLTGDWTLKEDELLCIPKNENISFTVAEGKTLQIDGHLLCDETGKPGTLTGTLAGNTTWLLQSSAELDFTKITAPAEGDGFFWDGARLVFYGGFCYTKPILLPAGVTLEIAGDSVVLPMDGERPLTFAGGGTVQGDGKLQLAGKDSSKEKLALSVGGIFSISDSVKLESILDTAGCSVSGDLLLSNRARLVIPGNVTVGGSLKMAGQTVLKSNSCKVKSNLTLTDSAGIEQLSDGYFDLVSSEADIVLSGDASLKAQNDVSGNSLSLSGQAVLEAAGTIYGDKIQGSGDSRLTASDGISAEEEIILSGHAKMEASGEEYGIYVTDLRLSESASCTAVGQSSEDGLYEGHGLIIYGTLTRRDNAALSAEGSAIAVFGRGNSEDGSKRALEEVFDLGNADLHGAAPGCCELSIAPESLDEEDGESGKTFLCSFFPAGREPDVSNALKSVTITSQSEPPYVPPHISPTPEPKLPFTDVPESAWYYEDVKYVYDHELFLGMTETEFSPKQYMAREMLVTVLYRAAGEPELPENLGYPFADVDAEHYYADAVYWARANGIVFGVDNGHFGTGQSITRQDLCCMLYRYAEFSGADVSVERELSGYADEEKISGYAQEAVRWAVEKGILAGKGGGILDPQGTAQRCEVAAMLHRFLSL